jgi:hypothetical protein
MLGSNFLQEYMSRLGWTVILTQVQIWRAKPTTCFTTKVVKASGVFQTNPATSNDRWTKFFKLNYIDGKTHGRKAQSK